MRLVTVVIVVALAVMGCRGKQPEGSAPRPQPKRLEPLERVVAFADAGARGDGQFQIAALKPVGPPAPNGATLVRLDGEVATVNGRRLEVREVKGPLLLAPTPDTYLAQVAGWLAQLDDARAEVWLAHPDGAIAFRLTLRDESSFQAWLDEPVAGKVRIIQREDGFEVATNMGKLPGWDPNGPTVPLRGGQLDLTTLQRGLTRVHQRFPEASDLCFVPAFGVELAQTARAMASDYLEAETPVFSSICLVYPRPAAE